ncbi:CTP-dependent riboflavin kinase [Candidatus Bathyarchaeota archaeon]|nr:CTP-dependent riboflavin kinase [Candidatus Bathyarchaeota archaeon]
MARVKKITLKGRVFSGGGTGSLFVNLPWAKKQFKEKLGFNPYPGTLNLQLSPGTDVKELRDATKGIKIKSPEDFHEGRCFKAEVMEKVRGAIVIPDVPDYPSNLLEILAPIHLREALKLEDGMEVEVVIWLE